MGSKVESQSLGARGTLVHSGTIVSKCPGQMCPRAEVGDQSL